MTGWALFFTVLGVCAAVSKLFDVVAWIDGEKKRG